MPLATMASAISRTAWSSTRPANLFQLFQPMGGVSASLLALMGLNGGKGWCRISGGTLYSVSFDTFWSVSGYIPPRPPAAGATAGSTVSWSPLRVPLYSAGPRPEKSHSFLILKVI